jgi:hypothetical protein
MPLYRFTVTAAPARPLDPERAVACLERAGASVSVEGAGRFTARFTKVGIDYAAAQHSGIEAVLEAGLQPIEIAPEV